MPIQEIKTQRKDKSNDICEFQLDYSGRYKVVPFKCDWVDINREIGQN